MVLEVRLGDQVCLRKQHPCGGYDWEVVRLGLSPERPSADRDDFGDVTDFIGWYGDRVRRQTGIAKDDAYRLYLAYHEGPEGYAHGTHNKKAWLLRVARRVEARAATYQRQYDGCRDDLAKWWTFW